MTLYRLFLADPTPINTDAADENSVNVGVRFKSSVDGYVTGARFHKGSNNTGTHVAVLWSNGGSNLGQVTFSGESGSGWQQMDFASPIAIVADTYYVVSCLMPVGHYFYDTQYFNGVWVTSGVLYAPYDGEAGGQAIFRYDPSVAFPDQSFNAANYWVDVDFRDVLQSPEAVGDYAAAWEDFAVVAEASAAASGDYAAAWDDFAATADGTAAAAGDYAITWDDFAAAYAATIPAVGDAGGAWADWAGPYAATVGLLAGPRTALAAEVIAATGLAGQVIVATSMAGKV